MTIDFSQFKETFFEESFEGLAEVEKILVENECASISLEHINQLFRVIHSLKGSCGTFGYDLILNLTHILETYLDKVRSSELVLSEKGLELVLNSVDTLRGLLVLYKAEQTPLDDTQQLKEALLSLLDVDESNSSPTHDATSEPSSSDASIKIWSIQFVPHESIYSSGNEPLRFLRELESLGNYEVKASYDTLPNFFELNPENFYLSWDVTLSSDANRAQIEEVFEWIEDECDLTISELCPEVPLRRKEDLIPEIGEQTYKVKTVLDINNTQDAPKAQATSSIRVNVDKIDSLLNMVGELVITQSMLMQVGRDFDESKIDSLSKGLTLLAQNTRELQESVMRIRMVPISYAFDRLPRIVFDLCKELNKKVDFKVSGETTELDKTVMQQLRDPLIHLVRNALDHGLETPEERLAAGKSEIGTLSLDAYHQGGNIVIDIIDDGRGLNRNKILEKARENKLISDEANYTDQDIYQLIFEPGFSTAETVSNISGRGVGMDVVNKNVQSLGGIIDIHSAPGQGSTFSIELPLTLAILDGQLISLSKQIFIVPINAVIESLEVEISNVKTVSSKAELYLLREEYIPILKLHEVLDIDGCITDISKGILIIVESGSQKLALLVDELLEQQQIVIKSLEENYTKIEGISGATILGDGTVSLIFDIAGLMRIAKTMSPVKMNQKSFAAMG